MLPTFNDLAELRSLDDGRIMLRELLERYPGSIARQQSWARVIWEWRFKENLWDGKDDYHIPRAAIGASWLLFAIMEHEDGER